MSYAPFLKVWLLFVLCVASIAAAQEYKIAQIPNPHGALAIAPAGINASGQVAATVWWSPFSSRSDTVLYSNGVTQDLGSLFGVSIVTGINDAGHIVGTDYGLKFAVISFINIGGVFSQVENSGSPMFAYGNAINNADQVTGLGDLLLSGSFHAFIDSNGIATDLGVLPGGNFSAGSGINNKGVIVGGSNTATGATHAFYTSGTKLIDMGTLPGGSNSYASAINDCSMIVGASDTPSGNHAFLYSHGKMIDIGTLPGTTSAGPRALNNRGVVVGSSGGHAFIYRDGKMRDLNHMILPNSGWVLVNADGINEKGEIAVTASDASGIAGDFGLVLIPFNRESEDAGNDGDNTSAKQNPAMDASRCTDE